MDLNVSLAAVCRSRLRVLDIIVVLISGGTGAAEEAPSQEQQPRRAPADVERGPELPLLSAGQHGVVEITNNGAGAPADGNEHREACGDEDDARRHGHFALFPGGGGLHLPTEWLPHLHVFLWEKSEEEFPAVRLSAETGL